MTFGKPERVGKLPVRTERSVAVDSEQKPIGFVTHIYDGPEVLRQRPDGSVDPTLLQSLGDIQEGVWVVVPGFFGYHRMKVERDQQGTFTARSESLSALLQWDIDDRHCWTIGGLVDLRSLQNLSLKK